MGEPVPEAWQGIDLEGVMTQYEEEVDYERLLAAMQEKGDPQAQRLLQHVVGVKHPAARLLPIITTVLYRH